MPNFTQNLSDSLVLEGIQPTTKWGTPMKWGTDLWGVGGTNFPLPTISRILDAEAQISTDAFFTSFSNITVLSDNLTAVLASTSGEYLIDQQGYYRVFNGGTTNNENTPILSYVAAANAATSWSLSTNSSTSWVSS